MHVEHVQEAVLQAVLASDLPDDFLTRLASCGGSAAPTVIAAILVDIVMKIFSFYPSDPQADPAQARRRSLFVLASRPMAALLLDGWTACEEAYSELTGHGDLRDRALDLLRRDLV